MKILRNAIECRYCGKVLESHHRHDYKYHTCRKGPVVGKVKEWKNDVLVDTHDDQYPWMMVDGGLDYIRRSADTEHFIDRSEYEEEPDIDPKPGYGAT